MTSKVKTKKSELRDYEEIVESLKDLPMTWYPGLLIDLTKLAYGSGCFQPGGASRIIKRVEEKERL